MSVKCMQIFSSCLIMSKRQQLASQNREDLLEAAIHIFRKHGIRSPLQLVIDEAGLGRATFYRNFKDRRELVIALMEQALERLDDKAKLYAKSPDGFLLLIENHVQNLPYLTALMEYWRVIQHDDPVLTDIYQRRDAILQPLIDQAIVHQFCRADFTARDYAMITAILRSSFQGVNDAEQMILAKRAIDLLINGIKA